jgi:hypothetical protein
MRRLYALSLSILAAIQSVPAATLIDFDMTGRPASEGLEPGYTEWAVGETTGSASTTVGGITFTVARNGGAGTSIKSYYYKAGVQSPNYARLVCDALSVVGGDAGASIRVTISGMASGSHSLLVYHNAIDGNQHGNIKVVVNGTTAIASQPQTNEVLTTAAASYSYVTFSGTSATIDYTSLGNGTYNDVFLDNLSLDVANPAMQANTPSPEDHDFHADADIGSITLSWKAASGAKSHDVYFGTDSTSVAKATRSSSQYQGNQTATTWTAKSVSNLKTYWWRIDEIDAAGAATPSNAWAFSPRHLAFPGAEGYGRYARGGRGGKVVHVTNLNDSGAGSLREAVENDIGPRTIVFDVSGMIKLLSRLTLASSNVTIAGQTAPSKGIVVHWCPFGMSGISDGIIRFLKVRLGYSGVTWDGTGLQGSDNSIMDHASVSWTIDESFSSRNAKNITLQRSMISEALNIGGHQNYPAGTMHGYAGSIGGDVGSFHHNLLAHNDGRNWSMACGLDGNGYYWGREDISNNVVYNWYTRATDGGCHEVNFVNNYYKVGPATTFKWAMNDQWDGFPGTQQYYCHGNIVTGVYTDTTKANNGCTSSTGTASVINPNPWATKPFFPSYANIQTAYDAYKIVLSDVGMTAPVLDDHDKRIVHETYTGTYTYKGSLSGLPGLPDRETDVGGFESYPSTSRASNFDTDGDGLPDWYEAYIGTNPKSASGDFSDANADPVGDGYTNLERYLDYMATPHQETKSGAAVTFNLNELFRGYQSTSPSFKAGTNSCLTTSIKDSTLTVTPTSACGIASLPLTVVDKEGSTMTRNVDVFVTGSVVTTGIVRGILPVAWNFAPGRIGIRTEGFGTLTVRDLFGRTVAQASGSGEVGVYTRDLPSRTLVASFDAEGVHERRVLPVVR